MKSRGSRFWPSLMLLAVFLIAYVAFGAEALEIPEFEEFTVDDVVEHVLEARANQIENGDVSFGDDTHINVLLLGLDSRSGDTEEPHCDAIHMFTLDIENWDMVITSVPRGTYSYIPYGPYEEEQYYLANACAFAGLDYGIQQIEYVVGVQADYVVTVGFSQAIGILRVFDLPTTESLQWLRHRQSYAIGDPQRSHNQAVFMKDVIQSHLSVFRSGFTLPMQYLLYTFVDTDMEFSVARALLQGFVDAEIDARPDDIVLQMRPYYETQDYHFDFENYEEQIDALVEWMRPWLSDDDLAEISLETIQQTLIDFINSMLASEESVGELVEKQLWLQIEDDETREELHYAIIETYVAELGEEAVNEAIEVLSNYILEKETLGLDDWAKKGKTLLGEVLE